MRRHLSKYTFALCATALLAFSDPLQAMLCGPTVTSAGGRVALIVNAKSSGSLFVPELHERGFGLAHIQAFPEDHIHLPPEIPFIFSLGHRVNAVVPSWMDLTSRAVELRPEIVIAGNEGGVRLAVQIERRLGYETYTDEEVEAFRSKFAQSEVLRKAGVRVAKQKLCASAEEMLAFIHGTLFKEMRRTWPVILKPDTSSGSEDVYRCWNDHDCVEKFGRIHMKLNKNLELNTHVNVQENLNRSGKAFEMVFDGESWKQKHLNTDIWHYVKQGTVYDHDFMVPYDGAIPSLNFGADPLLNELVRQGRLKNEGNLQEELRREGFKALSALKARGATHGEWMYDPAYPEEGWAHIETGSRTQGGYSQMLVREVTGYNQIDYTLDLKINQTHPDLFLSKLDNPGYKMTRYAMCVNLQTQRAGARMAKPEQYMPFLTQRLDGIVRYPIFPNYEPDEELPKTIDLKTSPGEIRIIANTYEELMAALALLRRAEKQGLFEEWGQPKDWMFL